MKGYKAVNMNCTSKQGDLFEVGKTYTTSEELFCGVSGFHFCKKLEDTFLHFDLKSSRFYEISATGDIVNSGNSYATNRFLGIRELKRYEVINMAPTFFQIWERTIAKFVSYIDKQWFEKQK